MNYTVNLGGWRSVFAVPDELCTRYLKSAGELQLKAILLLLCEKDLEAGPACEILGCTEEQLGRALDYWVDKGLLTRCRREFTPGASVPPPAGSASAPAAPMPAKISAMPVPDSHEAALRVRESEELRFFFERVQDLMGRSLSNSEIAQYIAVMDYTSLKTDIMLLIVEYCSMVPNRKGLSYIKKIAADWGARGIDTHEAADALLKQMMSRDEAETTVKSVFDIRGRSLVKKELDYACNWIYNMGFGEEMLAEAYSKCIISIAKLSFPYINKILEDWHRAGYKTVEETRSEAARQGPAKRRSTAKEDDLILKNMYMDSDEKEKK